VVARSNADLQRVLDLITGSGEVERASSVIALATEIPARVLPLLRATQDDGGEPRTAASELTG
jgi:hypothetical protein